MSLARAISAGDPALLPTRRDEDWRWTDLRGLIRALPAASEPASQPPPAGPFDGLAEDEARLINGRGDPAYAVAPGARKVLALRVISAPGAGAHSVGFSISVGAGGSLTLLESHEALAEGCLSDVRLDIDLQPGASLERVVLARDNAEAVSVVHADIQLSAGARLGQTVLTNGARRQRIETHVAHPGDGARVRLDGFYRLTDRRHADLTTVVTHQGVEGQTDQLCKGVAGGQSRGVFQGRIVVQPGADRTEARMGHHALVLGDAAEVDGKPELLIFADDVSCSHGNTIGALDEESLFYAMQRGVPEAEARLLLTGAFLGEVIDRIEHAPARRRVAELLGFGDGEADA